MGRFRFRILGIMAPFFFVVSVAVLGHLKPGYSHVYNTISELGEAGSVTGFPVAWVFIVTGVMITGFGYGLHQVLRRGDRRVWTGVLVMVYGILDYVGSGFFPVDFGGASTSLAATIHVYATLVGNLRQLVCLSGS